MDLRVFGIQGIPGMGHLLRDLQGLGFMVFRVGGFEPPTSPKKNFPKPGAARREWPKFGELALGTGFRALSSMGFPEFRVYRLQRI